MTPRVKTPRVTQVPARRSSGPAVAEAARVAVEAATAAATAAARAAATASAAPTAAGVEAPPGTPTPVSGRAQLTTFLDLSAQIFCITDLTGSLVWWNPAFERTLGYGAEELRHLRLDDLVHPEDREVRRAAEAVLAENGEAGLTQIRFCTRQGEWRWLEWTTRVDFGRQRVYGAARDVTERRQDEIALRESEARLRAIMRYSPSVIFVMDLEGRYLLVNDEFSRASGISMEAAVGMTAEECWPEDVNTIPGRQGQLIDDGASFDSDDHHDHGRRPPELHGEPTSSFATRPAHPSRSVGSPRTRPNAEARRGPWPLGTASSTP